MQVVRLHFYGYTWERFRWQIVHQRGALIVYRGKLDAEGYVKMKEILYIAHSTVHELYQSSVIDSIMQRVNQEEMLFFSHAEVNEDIADDIVSILVNAVRPALNKGVNLRTGFIVESRGNCELIPNVICY